MVKQTPPEITQEDIALARVLLNGFVEEDEQGLPHQRYYTDGHDYERQSRMAIVRLLRSQAPLPHSIRDALANLFEPVPSEDSTNPERVIKIQFRSASRRRDHPRNTAIVQYACDARKSGASVEVAIAKAAEKFGLSEETIWNIWRSFRWARDAGLFD